MHTCIHNWSHVTHQDHTVPLWQYLQQVLASSHMWNSQTTYQRVTHQYVMPRVNESRKVAMCHVTTQPLPIKEAAELDSWEGGRRVYSFRVPLRRRERVPYEVSLHLQPNLVDEGDWWHPFGDGWMSSNIYVYIYICIYIGIYICIYIHVYMHTCIRNCKLLGSYASVCTRNWKLLGSYASVSWCVCVCAYIYICMNLYCIPAVTRCSMHVYMCISTRAHAHTYAHIRTHAHTHTHKHTHTLTQTNAHTHARTHAHKHTHTHTHTHTYTHIHVHTHTRTHTHQELLQLQDLVAATQMTLLQAAPFLLRCHVLQCIAVCCSVLQCVAVCCSVLQCVAVCCSVLQCGAVCCRVL